MIDFYAMTRFYVAFLFKVGCKRPNVYHIHPRDWIFDLRNPPN